MKLARALVALLALAVTCAASAQIRLGAVPALSYAVVGDSASGEVVSADDSQLRLNVTPCGNRATVVVFHKPFVKTSAVQCNGVDTGAAAIALRRTLSPEQGAYPHGNHSHQRDNDRSTQHCEPQADSKKQQERQRHQRYQQHHKQH